MSTTVKRNGNDLRKWYISKLGDGFWAIMPPVERLKTSCPRYRTGAEALASFATHTNAEASR